MEQREEQEGRKEGEFFFLISFDFFFACESALNMAAFWRRLNP